MYATHSTLPFILAIFLAVCRISLQTQVQKKNVLLIVGDDMGTYSLTNIHLFISKSYNLKFSFFKVGPISDSQTHKFKLPT